MDRLRRTSIIPLIALLLCTAMAVAQGTKITAPKNNYKPSDDVQIGREAAAQVSKELPLLPEDGNVDTYVERVGAVLAAAIPPEFQHGEFHYVFSVVNASDINAFALPGGAMFVNRGMIESARTEGEMAGVMAHEISHVALRHGTAQQPSQSGKSPGTDCAGSETPKSLVGSTELVCGILANPGDLAAHAARPYNVGDRIEQIAPNPRLGLALSR